MLHFLSVESHRDKRCDHIYPYAVIIDRDIQTPQKLNPTPSYIYRLQLLLSIPQAHLRHSRSLRMSSSKADLTPDEHVLHHHASTLQKNLEAYRACELRDEAAWVSKFRELMV